MPTPLWMLTCVEAFCAVGQMCVQGIGGGNVMGGRGRGGCNDLTCEKTNSSSEKNFSRRASRLTVRMMVASRPHSTQILKMNSGSAAARIFTPTTSLPDQKGVKSEPSHGYFQSAFPMQNICYIEVLAGFSHVSALPAVLTAQTGEQNPGDAGEEGGGG